MIWKALEFIRSNAFFYREIVKNTKNMESNFRNIKTNE